MYHASELAAGSVFTPTRAVIVLVTGFVGFVVVAGIVGNTGVDLAWAVIAGEAMLVAIPVAFVVRTRGTPAMLGLRRSPAIFIVAALLIGASQWFLNAVVIDLLERTVDLPDARVEELADIVGRPSLPLALLSIAVLPAIGEELVFRGVLARALATRFVPAAAIVLSAIAFSAFHLSLIQAAPTFLLGLVYGYLALRARSAIPTMIAHFTNNALAILVARGELPWLASAIDAQPYVAFVVAFVMTGVGIALVMVRPRSHA